MHTIYTDLSGVSVSISLNDTDRYHFDLIVQEGPNRNYVTLRPGWPDHLFTIIVRETSSRCCFSFKRADISMKEFKTTGTCKECDGKVYVVSKNERKELLIQISEGKLPHTFTATRRLAKERAADFLSQMKSDTVHNVHIKMVNELDDELEHLPRDFVSHKSLENLKYKANANNKPALIELRRMKYCPQYGSCIKSIGSDPFKVIFWTKEQLFCFFQIKKRQRVSVSLDATGGIVSGASLYQDIKQYFDKIPESPHIMLYLLCVKNELGTSVPVGQMLSAEQDHLTIGDFLIRWTHEFALPDEFVVDDSGALQKAIIIYCTRFKSVNDYLKCCFDLMEGQTHILPECYLRLDVPHYTKNWSHDSVFKKIDK